MVVNDLFMVAGSRPWDRRIFEREIRDRLPGQWLFMASPEELDPIRIVELSPRFIFFLHWSWKVPESILAHCECVCFHMTDVPFGRGGSPLQNLITRGHGHTQLTALRMEEGLDTGPVYLKERLCLHGNAEEIYLRAGRLSASMIGRILAERPEPVPQQGEAVFFKRRTPAESLIPSLPDLDALHDFIRMLDAEGYPHAFIEHGGFRIEFQRAARYDGRIQADVTIVRMDGEES